MHTGGSDPVGASELSFLITSPEVIKVVTIVTRTVTVKKENSVDSDLVATRFWCISDGAVSSAYD